MEDCTVFDKRIVDTFSKLFAYSRLYDSNGEEYTKQANDTAYEPYVSRESYYQASPTIRQKLLTFARYFDSTLLQSIMEWEEAKSGEVRYSRIQTRARLIARSARRELFGHL